MIDRIGRDNSIELLQQLRSGEIDIGNFLAALPGSYDAAIPGIGLHFGGRSGAPGSYIDEKQMKMKITEMRSRDRVLREIDRAVVFLQTDLEYEWRERSDFLDPTLAPFQILIFLITIPFLMIGFTYFEELEFIKSHIFVQEFAIVLLILACISIILVGGDVLRSLFTGIDYRVWPFYRRKDYDCARD